MKDWKINAEVYGNLPMFPLKNAHLFPGAVLPLHIFEPRYIEMIEHVLDNGSNAIAISSLKSSTEDQTPPPVRSVMGAGVIFAAEKLDEGRWNVLLRGVSRVKLDEELPQTHQFRRIRCAALEDQDVALSHPLHGQLRSLLGQLAESPELPVSRAHSLNKVPAVVHTRKFKTDQGTPHPFSGILIVEVTYIRGSSDRTQEVMQSSRSFWKFKFDEVGMRDKTGTERNHPEAYIGAGSYILETNIRLLQF
jgi:hypothetical protein